MALGIRLFPDCYYHAVWWWRLDQLNCCCVAYRRAGTWHVVVTADGGDTDPAGWETEAEQTPEELEKLMSTAYEGAVYGARTADCPITPAVKVDLRCHGQQAMELLRQYAAAGKVRR